MANDILKKIVAHKKKEVLEARRDVPEKELREAAAGQREKRPFFTSLSGDGGSSINIIAEIKRASPSKGDICPDLDPAFYAAQYERGGAAALSVLTDTLFFKGSFEDFRQARQAASLPMLRKDFLISSYQIYESAVIGADAVLLITRILSHQQLRDYLALCQELGLDSLVEVHSDRDLESATQAGAALIGINNRNLSSFETDISTATRMVSQLEPFQTAVAASGIHSKEDIQLNLTCGIRNFLIGESLVRADDPALFLKSLMRAQI
jgi:indole-3-glycerol phosphate synthase